jgi:hypothetical protein
MKITKWDRPRLPDGHSNLPLHLGGFLGVAGVAVAAWGGVDGFDMIRIIAGSVAASLGLTLLLVGLILGEIRQGAYEAALRAGEVTEAK